MPSFLTGLLTSVDFSLLEQGYEIGLDWLGHFARIIIEGVGIIGLGIIVFTLVLKAITLPFDIYQRVKMRKQTLIMRQMQPELEKLQQQYANDKNMYSQKMMELYKKNGYSMLGACLPMIISLVILIVAFQGFRTYSQYANLNMYVGMSEAYNAAILENSVEGIDYSFAPEEGKNQTLLTWEEGGEIKKDGVVYTMRTVNTGTAEEPKNERYLYVSAEDETKFVSYRYSLEVTNSKRIYMIDLERLYRDDIPYQGTQADKDNGILTAKAKIDEYMKGDGTATVAKDVACKQYVAKVGALAAANWYHENDASFLWIKNVWYPDVTYNHPIQEYSSFEDSFGNVDVTYQNGDEKPLARVLDEASYNSLISELTEETDMMNGYFILIILSIGFMILSQLISMKSQKESNKYQTVDGSGARSQKIMLVMMPLIYAMFAFMYSAAFSIYMTMSSIISILVTLISNLVIGRIFRKKEEEKLKEKYTRKLPWMKDDDKDKKGKKKK